LAIEPPASADWPTQGSKTGVRSACNGIRFWATLEAIRAALGAGHIALAIAGMVMAVVGAFYYLRIIKAMFLDDAARSGMAAHPDRILRTVFAANAIARLPVGRRHRADQRLDLRGARLI